MQNKKFSLHDFTGGRWLSREEMKNVVGGMAAPSGGGGGTCQGLTTIPGQPSGTGFITTGQSSNDASTGGHTHWCCDSCCTATWADHSGCSTAS